MGIPGLTTYMGQYSDIYLVNYYLQNSYLVVDGNSIASQLYLYETKNNCCFGGDYDKYAYAIIKFFDELLQCNIVPLVIIDGGAEDKKLSTIYKRTRDRIQTASTVTPARQTRTQLFPLLLKEVFKKVAQLKGIKVAQSLFEADEDIASIARILQCPVLSFDSDFYIFDVMYIPYNTLDQGVIKNPYGEGFVKRCKIYKIEYFMQRFPGMDRRVLPLAATLLGNDYICRSTFKDFFATLKLSKLSKRRFNELQRRIEATFRWIQKHTLDSAIAQVLGKINPAKRAQVLEVMEMIINGYLVANPRMMAPLGFTYEFISQAMLSIPYSPYKFQQDVRYLQAIEEPKAADESDLSCDEEADAPPLDRSEIIKPENENRLYGMVPKWFIEEFNAANFPSYFIDMITRQLYVCPVQIEDYSQPTCINVSLKIVKVIFRLLEAGTCNTSTLSYVTRTKMCGLGTFKLTVDDVSLRGNPELSQLRDMPLLIRKEIIDKTLGVTDALLKEFPPDWRLYLATVNYWIGEADEQFSTNCHLYSLMFGMLFHVIDRKIGFHRSQSYFEANFGDEMRLLQQARATAPIYPPDVTMPIINAYNLVTREDCILALPFFLPNFSMDKSVLANPKKYHVSTVHAYSLFQNSLRHALHLNALLGYPYRQTDVAELYNGTLLYNLYNNFKGRGEIDSYISGILRIAPSLDQLFISMMSMARIMFAKSFANKVNSQRRKSKNKNRGGAGVADDEGDDDVEDAVVEDSGDASYADTNNRYAPLNAYYS